MPQQKSMTSKMNFQTAAHRRTAQDCDEAYYSDDLNADDDGALVRVRTHRAPRPHPAHGEPVYINRRNAFMRTLKPARDTNPQQVLDKIDRASEFKNDTAILSFKASILEKMGRTKQSIQTYEQVLRINPLQGIVQLHLARLYLNDNQMDKARAAFHKSINLIDTNAPRQGLAELEFKQNNFDQCRKLIATILVQDPKHLEMRTLLGRVEMRTGNVVGARGIFACILRDYPDYRIVRDLADLIDRNAGRPSVIKPHPV